MSLDTIEINFSTEGIWVINSILAIIMFGVALGITIEDFKRLFKTPKILLTGIITQFIILPLVTFLLVLLIQPAPSIALGMFMVAACPGGNISNFMTQMAKGNTALSVSLTAFATLVAVFMTPLNLSFWGNCYAPTSAILERVALDPFALVKIVSLILGLPLIIGMYIRYKNETLASKIAKILRPFSITVFIAMIIGAFYQNTSIFIAHIHYVFFIVLAHNIVAIGTGYFAAKVMRLGPEIERTLSIEIGIQNSGLGLMLIFSFFNGLGGMALLVAFWAIWDIISGLLLAWFWSQKKYNEKNSV